MMGLLSYLAALGIGTGTWLLLNGKLRTDRRGPETVLTPVAAGTLLGTLGIALGSGGLGVALAVIGAFIPLLVASGVRRRRIRSINRGIAPALEQLAKVYLVQPHPYAAIKAASSSIPEPLRTEFNRVIARCEANMPLSEALREMAERLDNIYMHQLVQVVDVALKTGLNLQEALDSMVDEIRSAQELRAEREAATSAFYIVTYLFTGLELLLAGNLLLRYPTQASALWGSTIGQMVMAYVTVTTLAAILLPRLLSTGDDLMG